MPAGRPRTRTDEEIVAAVHRAVGAHGVARLTLAGIAAEAGLAPSSLLARFGSKRALLLAAARQAAAGVEARIAGAVLGDGLLALAGPVSDRRELAHHLGLLELDVADDEFRAAAAAHAAAVQRGLRAAVLAAVAAGDLRADADPDRLARALHVAYNGALVLWALAGTGELAPALAEDLEAVLAPWRT
jgi:AcrR family transcriptional regulator